MIAVQPGHVSRWEYPRLIVEGIYPLPSFLGSGKEAIYFFFFITEHCQVCQMLQDFIYLT